MVLGLNGTLIEPFMSFSSCKFFKILYKIKENGERRLKI